MGSMVSDYFLGIVESRHSTGLNVQRKDLQHRRKTHTYLQTGSHLHTSFERRDSNGEYIHWFALLPLFNIMITPQKHTTKSQTLKVSPCIHRANSESTAY